MSCNCLYNLEKNIYHAKILANRLKKDCCVYQRVDGTYNICTLKQAELDNHNIIEIVKYEIP